MINGKIFLWIFGILGGGAVLVAVVLTIIGEIKDRMKSHEDPDDEKDQYEDE